jgi:hypothetical protein
VKFATTTRCAFFLLLASSLWAAGGSDKKENSKIAAQSVDSGSFGIFLKGQRVATETFAVEQKNGVSIVRSQLKDIAGSEASGQKSNLEMTASGELVRYEWEQVGSGSLLVVPNNDFLLEKTTLPGVVKPAEQPFLMPSSSAILDNNFFVHREVLVWRYLAVDCKPENGRLKCLQGPQEFGTLVPQDRASMRVKMTMVGKEKVTIRGTERELLRLNLSGENFEWSLWVDDQDQFKLMRVSIPADNTEVVRD